MEKQPSTTQAGTLAWAIQPLLLIGALPLFHYFMHSRPAMPSALYAGGLLLFSVFYVVMIPRCIVGLGRIQGAQSE